MQLSLQMKREEVDMVQKAHEWAGQKEKVDRQREFLLENRLSRPEYSISFEGP